MLVSMFDNKPERCPFGHPLWPGKCQVSWQPCICAPAREAERGRGMGHVRVTCNACHDQLRQTVFYEPPHDVGHRPLTGWTSSSTAVLEPYRAQSLGGLAQVGPSLVALLVAHDGLLTWEGRWLVPPGPRLTMHAP
jgi:hypothetical protein